MILDTCYNIPMIIRQHNLQTLLFRGASALFLFFVYTKPIFAQYGENLSVAGLTNKEVVPFILSVINLLLGFLALIVFLIILIAGFKWMVSGGEPNKVKEAQASIKAAIVGLVVVFLSWSLVTFVFGILKNL